MGKSKSIADLTGIEKKYKAAVQNLAEKLTFQIESAYETVIERFYNDYEPYRYDRSYSTYLASSGYNDPFAYKQTGDFLTSGIEVSSNNIPGDPYRADKSWVFNRTFAKGIHGINRNTLIKYNKKRYGADVWKISHMPKNMTPAPKALMDKEFHRITRKNNIQSMLKNELTKQFV